MRGGANAVIGGGCIIKKNDGAGDYRRTRRCKFPERRIAGVRDKDIARTVDGDAPGVIEARGSAEAIAAAGIARRTCQSAYALQRRNLSDGVIGIVADVKVPGTVHIHSDRKVEAGRVAGAVNAAVSTWRTGKRADHPQ